MKKGLLIIGAVALMLGLAACGGANNKGADASQAPAASVPADAQPLNVTATNFKFDKPEYTVKKGQPVVVTLKSEDGVHGLTIQGQGVKLDNKKKTATFTPEKAGKYEMSCNIPCGSGHMNMKSVLIVTD